MCIRDRLQPIDAEMPDKYEELWNAGFEPAKDWKKHMYNPFLTTDAKEMATKCNRAYGAPWWDSSGNIHYSGGYCYKGRRCTFAHSSREIRRLQHIFIEPACPGAEYGDPRIRHVQYSGAPACRNLVRGLQCPDGEFCTFCHDESSILDEQRRIAARNMQETYRDADQQQEEVIEPATYGTLAQHGLPDFHLGTIPNIGSQQPIQSNTSHTTYFHVIEAKAVPPTPPPTYTPQQPDHPPPAHLHQHTGTAAADTPTYAPTEAGTSPPHTPRVEPDAAQPMFTRAFKRLDPNIVHPAPKAAAAAPKKPAAATTYHPKPPPPQPTAVGSTGSSYSKQQPPPQPAHSAGPAPPTQHPIGASPPTTSWDTNWHATRWWSSEPQQQHSWSSTPWQQMSWEQDAWDGLPT